MLNRCFFVLGIIICHFVVVDVVLMIVVHIYCDGCVHGIRNRCNHQKETKDDAAIVFSPDCELVNSFGCLIHIDLSWRRLLVECVFECIINYEGTETLCCVPGYCYCPLPTVITIHTSLTYCYLVLLTFYSCH